MHKRLFVFMLMVLVIPATMLVAQTREPRDYVITDMQNPTISEDLRQIELVFSVQNRGGDATDETTINIIALDLEGRILQEIPLAPLSARTSEIIRVSFPTSLLPAGSRQSLRVEVGLDVYELPGSPIAQNNSTNISVDIPQNIPPSILDPNRNTEEGSPIFSLREINFTIPLLELPVTVDFSQPEHIAIFAGITGILFVLLWIFTIILRLIFRRSPTFGTWQPPYANMIPQDPDTIAGRRQVWQQHAQNDLILAICNEGALHPVKVLLGTDNQKFSGWVVEAMRLSQYDMYGRVSRSEAVAEKKLVKRTNKIIQKSSQLSHEKLQKQTGSVVKGLVKQFKKHIGKRNAMLPVAFDFRFSGTHGNVRIVFELYQCQQGNWHQIDAWEPEMAIVGRTFQEGFTYTVNGQVSGESVKEYHKRLQNDLTWLLTEMLYQPKPEATHTQVAEVVEDNVPPDTLTGMKPVTGA